MAEGVPYYPLVEPIIPVADHTAAKIIASGDIAGSFTRGFAAMAQAAATRNKLQLEHEEMITDAALKNRQLDIQRENNVMDFDVGMKNANAISGIRTAATEAKAAQDANLFDHVTRIQNEVLDYQKEKQSRGLNDPHPKNISEFIGNHVELARHFENAAIPQIQEDIQKTSRRAKDLQGDIPVARYGAYRVDDGKGKGGFVWEGGVVKNFTPSEILAQLGNPDTKKLMTDALEASGLTKVQGITITPPDFLVNWAKQSREAKVTPTTEPRPSIAAMSQWMARRTSSRDGEQTLPQGEVDEAAATMAAEAGTPANNNNEIINPTDEEKEIARAIRAASMPGADKDRIKSIFQSKGYDPSKLSF